MRQPPSTLAADVAAVARISAVPTILRVVSEVTGLRLALVARVTGDSWTACAVLDRMNFGLAAGDQLDVATTLCSEVRDSHMPILIEHASEDPDYCTHRTPKLYRFESYIAVPILRANGDYFGNVCALDSEPARLRDDKTLAMMQLFAEMIGSQLAVEEESAADRAALAREREVAELHEQFIAVLGHDLRRPLAAITAGAGFLRELNADPTQREVLARMESSARRMSRLIGDVMDFARGRLGGSTTLARERVPIAPLVDAVVAEVVAAHPDRQIRVASADAGDGWVDSGRFAQVLSHLVANAVEHGTAGEPVAVTASRADGGLRIAVTNRGRPIPADVLPRLLQPYYRADERGPRSGLGLGLYIAATFVRAHGGTIAVESTAGGVTCFTVELPDASGMTDAQLVGVSASSDGAAPVR